MVPASAKNTLGERQIPDEQVGVGLIYDQGITGYESYIDGGRLGTVVGLGSGKQSLVTTFALCGLPPGKKKNKMFDWNRIGKSKRGECKGFWRENGKKKA